MGWRDSIKAQAPNFPRIRRYPVTIQTKPTDQGEKEPQDPSSVSIVSGLPHNAESEAQGTGSPETDNALSFVSIVSDNQHLSGKEREVPATERTENESDLWLQAWRELADMTQGIQESDWRFKGIMDLLGGCDRAFEAGSWTDFERLTEKVRGLCEKR